MHSSPRSTGAASMPTSCSLTTARPMEVLERLKLRSANDFDQYPKGTGCFLAPRTLLASAFEQFRTRYADVRLANDDTTILRGLAAKERIGISPSFACFYAPRTSLRQFFKHSIHRGTVFLDGHGTPDSRFFPVVLAFFPVSAALAIAALRRPLIAPAAAVALGLSAGAYGVRAARSRH